MKFSRVTLVVFSLVACATFLLLARVGHTQVNAQSSSPDALITGSTFGGKVVFNFTITVNSAIPKNGLIACESHIDVNEPGVQSITEKAFGLAHLVTGTTNQWACSVPIPYSWILTTASTDKAILTYKVTIVEAYQIVAANTTGSTVMAPLGSREADHVLGSISIPLNGATTSESIHVTI